MVPLIIIVLVVLAIIAAAVIYTRSRSMHLRERFGPEYDRAVAEHGGRRRAEAGLRAVEKRRATLEIRALSPESRERYTAGWRDAQSRFVDAPVRAVADADSLVGQVLRERGYPTGDFDEQAVMVAIDHPDRADDYRHAYAVHRGTSGEAATTDDLRGAFLRYRAVFDELVDAGDTSLVTDEDGAVSRAERPPVPMPADVRSDEQPDVPAEVRSDVRSDVRPDVPADVRSDGDTPMPASPSADGAGAAPAGAISASSAEPGLTPEEVEAEVARRERVERKVAAARGIEDPAVDPDDPDRPVRH